MDHNRGGLPRRVRLIVVESGTTGLVAHAATDGSDQTVVIAQTHRETPTELGSRVVRRVLMLERANLIIARTIVLLSPCYDADAMEARLRIARALVTHSASTRAECVELILSAGKESLDGGQVGLLAWVNALISDPGASAMTVALQLASSSLADPAPSSTRHPSHASSASARIKCDTPT